MIKCVGFTGKVDRCKKNKNITAKLFHPIGILYKRATLGDESLTEYFIRSTLSIRHEDDWD